MIKTFLEPYFDVDEAGTIAEAKIRMANAPVIDLALVDLILPNGTGVAAVRAIEDGYPMIPLVVATGMDIQTRELLRAGVHYVIRKPDIRQEKLVDVILDAIDRHAGIVARFVVANQMSRVSQKKDQLRATIDEVLK